MYFFFFFFNEKPIYLYFPGNFANSPGWMFELNTFFLNWYRQNAIKMFVSALRRMRKPNNAIQRENFDVTGTTVILCRRIWRSNCTNTKKNHVFNLLLWLFANAKFERVIFYSFYQFFVQRECSDSDNREWITYANYYSGFSVRIP